MKNIPVKLTNSKHKKNLSSFFSKLKTTNYKNSNKSNMRTSPSLSKPAEIIIHVQYLL